MLVDKQIKERGEALFFHLRKVIQRVYRMTWILMGTSIKTEVSQEKECVFNQVSL